MSKIKVKTRFSQKITEAFLLSLEIFFKARLINSVQFLEKLYLGKDVILGRV